MPIGEPHISPTAEAGFAIYVHWPFCAAKCPYCDFNSHVRHHAIDQARFLKAFEKELAFFAKKTSGRLVTSIFFGGGTPSLMDPETISGILDAIRKNWNLANQIEITMEANPQSVDAARFSAYHAAGVNRVSLGLQSLDDEVLKFLGRLHNANEALAAVEIAKDTFPRVSFDMIYARPKQSLKSWETELTQAISHATDHLSLYQLTIEEGTPFYGLHKAGKFKTLDEGLSADLYELTQQVCNDAGLMAYETSNHARHGEESRHNTTYWRYGEYVGVGPGAHGRIFNINNGHRYATETEKHPETWLERVETSGHGLTVQDQLSPEEQAQEFLMMGLRLKDGIDPNIYEQFAGKPLDPKKLEPMIQDGLLAYERGEVTKLQTTQRGGLLLNAITSALLA